jgi:hypothetical protein
MKPTIGRIVHFYTGVPGYQANGAGEGPYAAIITQVWSDTCVNLMVFPGSAVPFPVTSVVSDEDAMCSWRVPPHV